MEYIISFYVHIYIYIHFFITVISIRETSYLNLQSEAYLQQRKIHIVNDIECIYKRRNVHVT